MLMYWRTSELYVLSSCESFTTPNAAFLLSCFFFVLFCFYLLVEVFVIFLVFFGRVGVFFRS